MIDRNELKKMLCETEMALFGRIKRLSDIARAVDSIITSVDDESDEYLKMLIATQYGYRNVVNDVEKQFESLEQDLWEKMRNIDQ